ncbi:lipase family protein [Nocardioides sp. NPDC006273]|uniref:lipase family protein n=1 Tax=Nocardioides sp. NPDC006273 TaxID=3155598 RepID=UPI0033AD916B
MSAFVEHGWAMVATDYDRMGADGDFPYSIGRGEAYSVLDSVRAAREAPGVQLAEQTVVWGHSQGGHAALWAGQLASSYAPDAGVAGTAALSPTADPLGLAEVVTANPGIPGASLGVAFVADAYARTYDVALDTLVAPSARTIVREAASRCTSQAGTLFTILAGLAIASDQPNPARAAQQGTAGRPTLRERADRAVVRIPAPAGGARCPGTTAA